MKIDCLRIVGLLLRLSLFSLPVLGDKDPSAAPDHTLPIPSKNAIFDATYHSSFNASHGTNSSASPLATGTRPVYLIMHARLAGAQTIPPTYEKLFPVYALLHFNATSTDGPLEIQIINDNGQDLIRVTDWGIENSHKPLGVPHMGYLTDYFELFGKSNATNDQILNPATGKGIIHDVWTRNTSLSLKAYNSVDFMHACIAHLGLGLAPSNSPSAIIPTRIAYAQMFWRNLWVAEKVVSQYPVWLETLKGWGDQVQKTRTEFHWHIDADPHVDIVKPHLVPSSISASSADLDASSDDDSMSDLAAPEMTETYHANDDETRTAPEYQWIYSQQDDQQSLQTRDQPSGSQSIVADQYLVYNPGENDHAVAQKLDDGTNDYAMRPANDLETPVNRPDIAAEARTLSRKVLALVRPVTVVGSVAGVIAVVILDFRDPDNATSLVCALFSIIGGLLGLLLLWGPGFLSEAVMIAALFVGSVPEMGNVPTMNSPRPPTASVQNNNAYKMSPHWRRTSSGPAPALRNDVQGILQYTIVGDRNQTGNERCLSKGFKDCTVVYGPHLLAAALHIESFDAFALLIHFNEGYPMAMKDLIKAFSLSTDPDSATKVATIDCSHSYVPNNRYSWSNPNQASYLKTCDKPVFSIKRQLINIPIINEAADTVYGRMMPHGNCSLIGDVTGGEKYSAYNITIQGGAVAIACGVVGAINVNGTARPLNGAQSSPGDTSSDSSLAAHESVPLSMVNPGNQSSDGSSGRAYIAPPPPAPFQKTLNLTNSICMSTNDQTSCCFPNGTYSSQGGSLGFDSTKANTLDLISGSSLIVTENTRARSKGIYAHAPAPPPTYIDHHVTYKTNQTAGDSAFAADMQNMVKYKKDNTFSVTTSLQPDAVCFYQQPLGKGDFACFGPGGGDLPTGLKGKVRSVKALGRASVEIFANNYGNGFSHILDTYQDDLAQLPYDEHSSFADVAASIWVYLEPGPSLATDTGTSGK